MPLNHERLTWSVVFDPADRPPEEILGGDTPGQQATLADVLRRLAEGDRAAWCSVRVSCRLDGCPYPEGVSHLPCATFADQAEYYAGPYYPQMRKEAIDNLDGLCRSLATAFLVACLETPVYTAEDRVCDVCSARTGVVTSVGEYGPGLILVDWGDGSPRLEYACNLKKLG